AGNGSRGSAGEFIKQGSLRGVVRIIRRVKTLRFFIRLYVGDQGVPFRLHPRLPPLADCIAGPTHNQRRQNANDGDDDEHFNEGETSAGSENAETAIAIFHWAF